MQIWNGFVQRDFGEDFLCLLVKQPDFALPVQYNHAFLHAVEHNVVQAADSVECGFLFFEPLVDVCQIFCGKRGKQWHQITHGDGEKLAGNEREIFVDTFR